MVRRGHLFGGADWPTPTMRLLPDHHSLWRPFLRLPSSLRGEFKVRNVSERPFEELLEIHFHNSRELQSRLRNRTLFELLGEELPFARFQGRGCPNRTGSDGQDPYITAVAALIRHVYECNCSYFDSVASNKITEILKGRQRAQGRGLGKD